MSLLPVEDAKEQILAGVKLSSSETIELDHAAGRVLASDLTAKRNQPPFDASSMDGYAVKALDVGDAPCSLQLIGEAAAGQAFDGEISQGQCTRIFTGAPLPKGADAVVMQENTERDGNSVSILQSVSVGNFVRPIGLDFKDGEKVLTTGTKLNTGSIGLCASMNCATVNVRKRPTVAILATGDELVEPGQVTRPDQIVSSNSVSLAAAVRAFGGEPIQLGIAPDNLDKITAAISGAAQADILLTIGGASVGDHDLIGPAFTQLGIELDFWKIAMRPGKPLIFARQGDQRVIGLPGNPVSALVCARIFLKPLIQKMLGLSHQDEISYGTLAGDLRENDQRQEYMRACFEVDENGKKTLQPFNKQDSSMQMTFARSDVLIIRPPFAAALKKGDRVPYLAIDY